ncbi:MAG: flagellar hook-basal body complex protein FliE [Bdellovibrio sp.]|nr:MAG: flagellar hook-basal body complex protein FliE [Bdellovibrio sp.]
MDGLTVSNLNTILKNGTESLQKNNNNDLLESSKEENSFSATLKSAIEKVNALQVDADKKAEDLAVGKAKSIHEVMIAAEKADIAFKLMVQVRNKLLDAYQEIMKMQV